MSITELKATVCDCCGESGRPKGMVQRRTGEMSEVRVFCHDEEKSCFIFMSGRYFE